jgi:hypothetical protein
MVVPATFDERRFCVLNVSPHMARERSYFTALRKEMVGGGRAALLHHLQTIDLGGFDVRNPPMTEGLRDQKLQSQKNIERWWYEVLIAGDLPSGGMGTFDDEDEGVPWSRPISVGRTALRAAYREWMKDHRFEGSVLGEAAFGHRLKTLVPSIRSARPRCGGDRQRVYEIPPLNLCREMFENMVGSRVDWQD